MIGYLKSIKGTLDTIRLSRKLNLGGFIWPSTKHLDSAYRYWTREIEEHIVTRMVNGRYRKLWLGYKQDLVIVAAIHEDHLKVNLYRLSTYRALPDYVSLAATRNRGYYPLVLSKGRFFQREPNGGREQRFAFSEKDVSAREQLSWGYVEHDPIASFNFSMSTRELYWALEQASNAHQANVDRSISINRLA